MQNVHIHDDMTELEALKAAISILGSQDELAKVCGGNTKQQHVSQWVRKSLRLPPQHVFKVQSATEARGTKVPARLLCRDMFDGVEVPAGSENSVA